MTSRRNCGTGSQKRSLRQCPIGWESRPSSASTNTPPQAIIDEFGLHVVETDRMELMNGTAASYQIVSGWEDEGHVHNRS